MIEKPFLAVIEAMAAGTAPSSVVLSLLHKLSNDEGATQKIEAYKGVAATAYAGGADTTVSAISTFFLAMLLYPEVQRKAQEEIDRVVGLDRLPDFEDEPSMPYVTAVVREALRWRLVLPAGIPHRLTVDDEYKGYHLPAGSIIIPNTWAILHDEKTFPDPDSFIPERYLTDDGQLNPAMKDVETGAFGFGRRICPGRHMALNSMWIIVASVLATFTLSKPRDRDGNAIEPSVQYTQGLVAYPPPFKCDFKPRSELAAALIGATAYEDD